MFVIIDRFRRRTTTDAMHRGELTTNPIPDPIPKPSNAPYVAKTNCPTNPTNPASTLIFLDNSTIPKNSTFTPP
jgi:hypothetical protein